MNTVRAIVALSLILGVSACASGGSSPTGELSFTVERALYSTAAAIRAEHVARGATVSKLTLQDGRWRFSSSHDPDLPSSTISASSAAPQDGECNSESTNPQNPNVGRTSCQLYSDAKVERDAMIQDGHHVTEMFLNNGQWTFDWIIYPEE